MDERGCDTWMAEHHSQPEGTELIPNLLMMAMHPCGVTKNINIGCGFNYRADVVSAAPRGGLRDGVEVWKWCPRGPTTI